MTQKVEDSSQLCSSRNNDHRRNSHFNNQLNKTVSSHGNFSSIDDNEVEENIQQEQSEYDDRRESQSEMKEVLKPDMNEEPAPLVNSGYDLKIDIKLGWRPDKDRISGAPIPLHYDFGQE